ncbi:hypothetical protein BGW38_000382 [Lunasporangiospora selenospora]|uniref:Dilute domain-containing protein n=1 Tax=Lunasporangiospora selenospora TaxID=979761 RepID=A0A9P6KI84_9FUNG|nr:hypothetical protein BGW38_000382 [Lunasporangiospora selenospora]
MRRSHSRSDSLYSAVTESTEPSYKPTSTSSSTSPSSASPPAGPVVVITSSTAPSSLQRKKNTDHDDIAEVLTSPIRSGEQLDPWGSNPYDQVDLASTLHFVRRPGQDDDVDHADELRDTVTGLASPKSSTSFAGTGAGAQPGAFGLSPTTMSTQSKPMGVSIDALERLDREFEMLTKGQAIQISTSNTLDSNSPFAILDFSREQLDDPRGIIGRSIPDQDKRVKMSKLFSRASSNGDMNRVADMLDNFRDWIDIEAQDEDGTTPLIYAACFGHVEIAYMLIEAGATIDARDKFGWTPLVWATNNKNDNMVRMLLEQGASTTTQTAKGHTVVDFLRHDPNDNTKIVQIFQEPGRRDSISSNGSFVRTNNSSLGDDLFYQSGIEGFEEMMAENERRYRMAMESASAFDVDIADLSLVDQPQLDDDGEFDWEKCLPDQMFVFSGKDVPRIIEITITNMEPGRSRQHKPLPAYVIFLASRFAHYFSSAELLDELLDATFKGIMMVTKAKPEDMTLTAYWISNASVLLHFLRKDPGLSLSTGFHQVKMEALILDMVQMIIVDAERRIEKILEPAMLDHDTIQGLEEVKFQSDWAFLWRGKAGTKSNNSTIKRSNSPLSPNPGSTSTFAAASTSGSNGSGASVNAASGANANANPARTLRRSSSQQSVPMMNAGTYDIHPDMTHYVIAQLLYYISSEVFNRMMTNKKMLSRSKALQTRLNLSILEDWIRVNQLPPTLSDQFGPLVQLLQLLQVLSLQEDFPTWVETLRKLELLNPFQVKRVVSAYRFEVSEPRLNDEITQYVLQVAADTERMVRRQMMDRKRERPLSMMSVVVAAATTTTNDKKSTEGGEQETNESAAIGNSAPVAQTPLTTPSATAAEAEKARAKQRQREQEEEAGLLSETKNSKAWLHFKIPENMAEREGGVERVFVPLIPDEMMSMLDTHSLS